MRIISMLCAMLLISLQGFANGKVTGNVIDSKTGEPIIGAMVVVTGTDKGAATDIDGNFIISLAGGTYNIEIRYTSYNNSVLENVKVVDNQTTKLDVKMSPSENELDEVVIVAKANRESETALLVERQKSTEIVQKIGAQEMSRKGISDVAEGLTKVVGVSTSSSKSTVVRGLGDRYNNVTVNGLPIPSTNPDLKVIPLSVFPSGVIKNLAVSKSYSPHYYGDFAGGSIDIVTRDYSEKPFLRVGVNLGGNSITTGKRFLMSGTDFTTKLGFNRGERSLPSNVANTKYYDSKELGATQSPFNSKFSPEKITAGPNYGVNISGGNFHKLAKPGSGIGYYAMGYFRNNYRYSPGRLALYNAQQSPRYNYETDNYNYSANTTGILNVTYRINPKNSVSVTSMYVNDALNSWIVLRGHDNDLGELMSRRNTYIQNTLFTNQLLGKHEMGKYSSVNWGASYSKTVGSMPDRLQNTFRVTNTQAGETLYTFAADAVSNNQRFFGELKDDEYAGKLEYVYDNKDRSSGLINVIGGFNGKYKDRAFRSRSIDMKMGGFSPVDPDNIDIVLNGSSLGDGFTSGSYKYVESYYAPNDYNATLSLMAGYVNATFKFGKWQFIGGVRAEYANQIVYFKKGSDTYDAEFREAELDGIDFMPAVTIKHQLTEKSNLMLAASRTITRPQFVEVGPFRYNESFGTQEREGNPLLENGTNYNADLKWEWYPSNSEIVSFNILGKYMVDPIELVIVASSDPLLTYVNTNRAYVAGAEFEYSRNLGLWFGSKSSVLNNTSIGLNAAYLYSQIEIDDLSKLKSNLPIQLTNTKRPLMGASPYIINFDYSYRHNWNEEKTSHSQLTLTYNVFGKRVFAAGSQGAGDIYEMPVNTLDLTILNQLKNGVYFNLNFGNILNPDIVQKQYFKNNESLDVLTYKKGIDFSLTFGYQF